MDEVFGSENFVSVISFRKTSNLTAEFLPTSTDFILWYGKDRKNLKYRQLMLPKKFQSVSTDLYGCVNLPDGSWRRLTQQELNRVESLPEDWQLFGLSVLTSSHFYNSPPFQYEGKTYTSKDRYWSTSPVGLTRLAIANRLGPVGESLRYKRMIADFPVMLLNSQWTDTGTGTQTEERVYAVQTSTKVIERCLLMTTDPGDLVLDPTCGGGTTAFVAEQWGRRWITIDTSRVAVALARTRLMAAKFPYYLLADSPEGVRKEAELTGKLALSVAEGTPPSYKTEGDIKKGFVYERITHITMKAIANNEEIDTIHAMFESDLDPIRKRLNQLLKINFKDWQIPRELEASWSKEAKDTHAEWRQLRREKQNEIDAAIARRADTELLYNQPYVDSKRVRVCGPFSVESLSPHRVLATADENQDGTVSEQEGRKQQDFEAMILDNLVKAGVQNTKKRERIKFETLVPYAGMWLHATGTYTDVEEKTKRVAVCIGPEQGTVGPQLVKDAAKEAVQGVGFDLLLVCGFAFDPHVSEEAKRYGKLVVLPTKMNPDLAMGDELLKKTGAGNLFMVFGEPDVKISKRKGGEISVEIKGMDVYDPTTGEVRSSSTDDIACWFIDTDYNGESFFVRHAYFLGAGEPYEKLRRALRAEIDEAAWSSLYSTESRPFATPASNKIAVKVINHYGDEVLKVFEV